jgi:hypothetical protein
MKLKIAKFLNHEYRFGDVLKGLVQFENLTYYYQHFCYFKYKQKNRIEQIVERFGSRTYDSIFTLKYFFENLVYKPSVLRE